MSSMTVAALALGVVPYGLSATGMMPQGVYSRALGFAVAVQGGSGPFDGTWIANSRSSIEETDEAYCGTALGKFIVQGTRMYGSVHNEFGDTFMLTANVDNGGDVTGGMVLGVENVAKLSGVLLDSDGSGSWSDELGCYGTVAFERITARGSHDANYIEKVQGRVFVVRGVRTLSGLPGTTLQGGDVIAVEEGSSATLFVGGKTLMISEKTKFEIPEDVDTVSDGRASFFDRGWTALKYLIQGPEFEIKTPTAVAGARG
jgi:hypothetical protein